MSTKRNSTFEADPARKRPCHLHIESPGTVSYAQSSWDITPHSNSHAKEGAVEAVPTSKKNDTPETCLVGHDSAKNAPTTTNIDEWIGRVKAVSDAAVQTDVTTFPVDMSSVPLDHARLASEAGWSKYWRAKAESRELRKVIRKSNEELTEARKAIGESTKKLEEVTEELEQVTEELEEVTKELEDVKEELDDAIHVQGEAVSDARYWRGKCADMGSHESHYPDHESQSARFLFPLRMSLKRKKGFWSQTRVVRDPDAEDELLPPQQKFLFSTPTTPTQNPVTENQLSEPTKKSVSELNLVEEPGFDEEGNTFGWDWDGDSEDEEEEAIGQGEVGPGVKKRQARGCDPVLKKWAETSVDLYLSELLRLDGRHYSMPQNTCPDCSASVVSTAYRCLGCKDSRLYCKACLVRKHAQNPFHRIQQWNSSFFCRDTFHNLGFILLLGQTTGQICPCASLAPVKTLVALDVTGVHKLNILYCNCFLAQDEVCQLLRSRLYPATQTSPRTVATFRLLEHFHLLSFVSKASAREYYCSLERMTDNTSSVSVLWRLLKLLKRHGRGHDETDYAGTKSGECVVRCAPCPHLGINLPINWRLAASNHLWLYQLFLSMDANFCCVRLQVSSEAADPSLNRGCAYIIDSRTALDHIRTFGKSIPDDISSCSNHKALKLACMRRDPGLAVTGLATTDCSRHDAKLPCSCTDLQAGERYANMDLTLCSTLQHTDVDQCVCSYDIMCRFHIHFFARTLTYPLNLQPKFPTTSFVSVIPKFHLSAHQEGCHLDFNLNYTPRVGTTDGEGVERGWAVTNTLASSTKVMGPGSRHDVLDDHFGSRNWIKRTMFPKQFLAWSKENSNGCEEAVTAFKLFNAGIPEKTRIEWRTALENWEEDPKCHPNPYEPMVKATTFNKVRLRLAEAEAHELGQSSTIDAVNQEASLSSLLIEGLDFRELQQKLSQELAGAINYTEQAKSKTLEKANSLRRRIDVWCSTQALHFPAAVVIRRLKWELEYALAEDTLEAIRQGLLQRTYLYKWKDRYSHGQRSSTWSSATIAKLQDRINNSAACYQTSQKVLTSLAPFVEAVGWDSVLKDLKPEDIQPLNQDDIDPDLQGVNREGEAEMQDALHIGWCKARAHAHQYQEECLLLQEEMRRILQTYDFEVNTWAQCANDKPSTTSSPEYLEGRKAHTEYQRYVRLKMSAECKEKWKKLPSNLLSGKGAICLTDEEYDFV
ncbi:hypothetical protein K435DRAFT_863641 [Dendrothele bispora CBS 962.96]|uniref:CxC2-like cysteine cluster KDZ transposase-associated domain-containing protein n=1 Tax=Dendrothele bispora (strain CBS 962.96) TaxID=1314807 RepID=A0A4S8LPA1_DENBC|nr:hypothetical protein K435DRAFT_863641 [Dendrothele bispora CBS 962.96]